MMPRMPNNLVNKNTFPVAVLKVLSTPKLERVQTIPGIKRKKTPIIAN